MSIKYHEMVTMTGVVCDMLMTIMDVGCHISHVDDECRKSRLDDSLQCRSSFKIFRQESDYECRVS